MERKPSLFDEVSSKAQKSALISSAVLAGLVGTGWALPANVGDLRSFVSNNIANSGIAAGFGVETIFQYSMNLAIFAHVLSWGIYVINCQFMLSIVTSLLAASFMYMVYFVIAFIPDEPWWLQEAIAVFISTVVLLVIGVALLNFYVEKKAWPGVIGQISCLAIFVALLYLPARAILWEG